MKTFKQFILEGNPLSRIHKHSETGRHFVILSAHRPSNEASAEENKKRHVELKSKLTAQGYGHREVEGHWEGGKERSILVHAKQTGDKSGNELHRDMVRHAEHYNQDAILHHDGKKAVLHGTNDNGFPGKGKSVDVGRIAHNKPNAEFQTETKPKSDRPLKKGRTDKSSARFTTEKT